MKTQNIYITSWKFQGGIFKPHKFMYMILKVKYFKFSGILKSIQ